MRLAGKVTALALLLALAGGLAFAAHATLGGHAHRATAWEQAASLARRADRMKAIVPALALRARAVTAFDRLAAAGPAAERSRAALLAGLLELENSGQDRGSSRAHLEEAAAAFKRAVRLDPGNDDAAYDLELLLTRSKALGRAVGQARPERRRSGVGRPGTQTPGSGY